MNRFMLMVAKKSVFAEYSQAFHGVLCPLSLFIMLTALSERATALHTNMLFHWPKKSAVLVIGQNKPKGIIQDVATITF